MWEPRASADGEAGGRDDTKSWSPDPVQPILDGHVDWVRDVAWAPSVGVGRSYIASAGQVRDLASCGSGNELTARAP